MERPGDDCSRKEDGRPPEASDNVRTMRSSGPFSMNAARSPMGEETSVSIGPPMAASGARFYPGKRIVVTGALGFLGTRIVRMLAEHDGEVVRVARRAAPVQAGRARMIDIVGDVRHRATWTRALDHADIVFHLAAQTGAVDTDADRHADFESNVRPVLHLLDACAGL